MTKSELKDIIKECLLEMNTSNRYNENSLLFESNTGMIFDEIIFFENNINYILSQDESVILSESVGSTVKLIFEKIIAAVKGIIKKIGEFYNFAKTKVKSIFQKQNVRTERIVTKAKEVKSLPNAEVSEEKVEEAKEKIEETNKKLVGAIEDFNEYCKQKDYLKNNIFDTNKLDKTKLYSVSISHSWDFSKFETQLNKEIEILKDVLGDIHRKINNTYDSDVKVDFSKYYDFDVKYSFETMKPDAIIDPNHILSLQEDYKKNIESANHNIDTLTKLQKTFEELLKDVEDRYKFYTDDSASEMFKINFESYGGKLTTAQNICTAAIKGCSELLQFFNKFISIEMKAYNLSLLNAEIILACVIEM